MASNKEERIRFANDELIGKGNLSVVDDVFATDYVVDAGGKDFRGTAFVGRFISLLRAALPDLHVVDVEFLLQAGATIAWTRTLNGTHESTLSGIPPSGRKVEWSDMVVSRFDGEKIAEEWVVSDLARQLLLKLPRAR